MIALAESVFADCAQCGERRAQLVGRIGGDSAELGEGVFEALQRLIEHRCKLPELVMGMRDRKPLPERIRRDALRAFSHRSDRPQ